MKRAIPSSVLSLIVLAIACTATQSAGDAPRINKDDLKAKLGTAGIVLIDVRTAGDWDKSSEKITGAVRMDPKTVDTWAATLPKEKEIVLYCA